MAARGAIVTVLERDRVGAGASSRNAGQVLTGVKLDAATLVKRYGAARARQLFDASLDSIAQLERLVTEDRIDCEFTRCGHLQAACKPSHFEAMRDEQRVLATTFGHRVELIGKDAQSSEIGTTRYFGVLVDPASASVNPAKYVAGLAQAARRAGARIDVHTSVLRLDRNTPGWLIETNRGTTKARDVVLATDAYVSSLTPGLQRRIVPVGSYVIATEPLAADTIGRLLPRGRMAFDSKHFLYYFRMTADRRLLFGGRAEFGTPSVEKTRRAAEILRTGMVDVFPELRPARIDYAWSGLVGMTRDQLPHAGRLGGLFYACGYSGHGIAMATTLGDAIGRLVAGEPVQHPLLDDALPAVPLHFGKPWFLPIAGAYFRLKDWTS
jgi:glycine/D-amino acid oxidase-like deaminating enzyme